LSLWLNPGIGDFNAMNNKNQKVPQNGLIRRIGLASLCVEWWNFTNNKLLMLLKTLKINVQVILIMELKEKKERKILTMDA